MKIMNSRTCARNLSLLAVALLVMPFGTSGQSGTAKPAAYECSGLEGAALTSCKGLNAAAANSANITTNPSSSHDCSGMTGGSLTTCMDLNGQLPQTLPSGSGAGQSLPMPGGTTVGLPQTMPSASTTGQAPSVSIGAASGQTQPLGATGQIVTPQSTGSGPEAPAARAPDGGHVPPPSDKIVPIPEGGRTTSALPSAPVSARPGANTRLAPASAK